MTKAEEMRALAIASNPAIRDPRNDAVYTGAIQIIEMHAKAGKTTCRVNLMEIEERSPERESQTSYLALLVEDMRLRLTKDGFSVRLIDELHPGRFCYWLSVSW